MNNSYVKVIFIVFLLFPTILNAQNTPTAIGFVGDKDVSKEYGYINPLTVLKENPDRYLTYAYNLFYKGLAGEKASPLDLPNRTEGGNNYTDFYGNDGSPKFRYTYDNANNIIIATLETKNIFDKNAYNKDIYVFSPFYGPMEFKFAPNGIKLFPNQAEPVTIQPVDRLAVIQERRQGVYDNFGYGVLNKKSGVRLHYNGERKQTEIKFENLPCLYYDYVNKDDYRDTMQYILAAMKVGKRDVGDKEANIADGTKKVLSSGITKNVTTASFFAEADRDMEDIWSFSILGFTGYPIIPVNMFSFIKPIKEDYFLTKRNEKYGLINIEVNRLATGKFIIYQNIYDSLIQLTNKDVLLAKYNDKFGVIDLKGNQVLNFNYSTYKISGNTLSLSADDRIYPFDIQTLASAKDN